jgi:uncharacterized protein (UPF0264 family)
LLVSVRGWREAEAALRGGASLIDVKEPRQGPLGRADSPVIQAVVDFVAGRCPVSAALGEWLEEPAAVLCQGLSFVKWGLAGCGQDPHWQRRLARAVAGLGGGDQGCRPVAVAYADWQRACAPRPGEVWEFAVAHRWGALLMDTWGKDGTTLLDWMSRTEVFDLCGRCREAGLPVALAGSVGAKEMVLLAPAQPTWFAVRGSVCRGGRRDAAISTAAVRRLARLLNHRAQLRRTRS